MNTNTNTNITITITILDQAPGFLVDSKYMSHTVMQVLCVLIAQNLHRLFIIKAVRELTGMGLKEAMHFGDFLILARTSKSTHWPEVNATREIFRKIQYLELPQS